MRILITNDDGIHAQGLLTLAKTSISRGHHVMVSAPCTQQSAASQRITLSKPLIVHEEHLLEGARMYAVEGTPADCVRVAPQLFDEPIDFCISGINDGENAGSAIYYSGTVSAAREAAMHYIPAMAVSIMCGADEPMREHLAQTAITMAENWRAEKLPRMCVVNINAPALPLDRLGPMKLCKPSAAYYTDTYERRVSPSGKTYFWLEAGLSMEPPETGSDYYYLKKGCPTCTILGCLSDLNIAFPDI